MPCFQPLSAWRLPPASGRYTGAPGKSKIFFSKDPANYYDTRTPIDLPCGQCIGCRLERSRRWAVRLMHEKQLHERTSFLTLTYDDDALPKDGSLNVVHFQQFMKRLRRGSSTPLKFFHCGEYGETTNRPHYHAILFGEDFAHDRKHYKTTSVGNHLYNSPRLTKLWGHGHAVIGDVTFESAAYVARYCLKKLPNKKVKDELGNYVDNPDWKKHYNGRKPEYVTMSRNPGIGAKWYEQFHKETYLHDRVVMRGKEMMPPPYYDKLLEKADPQLFEAIKRERGNAAKTFAESEDNRSRRLLDRRIVKEETIKNTLRRSV